MDGLTLLREARDAGLRVEAHGGRLVVQGPRRLEPVAKRLLAAKRSTMDALEAERDWRVVAMRDQVPAMGAIPVLIARPGAPFAPGACCSCGDGLTPQERYRCAACVTAAVTVLAEAS